MPLPRIVFHTCIPVTQLTYFYLSLRLSFSSSFLPSSFPFLLSSSSIFSLRLFFSLSPRLFVLLRLFFIHVIHLFFIHLFSSSSSAFSPSPPLYHVLAFSYSFSSGQQVRHLTNTNFFLLFPRCLASFCDIVTQEVKI